MTAARRASFPIAGLTAMGLVALLSGCISPAESGSEATTIDTVGGVGELPETVTTDSIEITPPSEFVPDSGLAPTTVPLNSAPPIGSIGQQAAGNRLLLIGDSLTASIARRYGNQACAVLVPLGWQVEVEAEVGRPVEFGQDVLNSRLAAGWDAAVIFLGNNYDGNEFRFEQGLNKLLLKLHPRPTVVITTTEWRDSQREVNDVIRKLQANFPYMTVLDWASITAAEPPLTGVDNLHLTESGRERLGYELAYLFGQAPVTPGKCLDSVFHDDSLGSPDGPKGNTTGTKSTVPTTRPPTTTIPAVTTSNPGTPTSSTAPSTNTTAKPTQTTNSVPVTTLPVTTPPSTNPPVTPTTPPASPPTQPTLPDQTDPP